MTYLQTSPPDDEPRIANRALTGGKQATAASRYGRHAVGLFRRWRRKVEAAQLSSQHRRDRTKGRDREWSAWAAENGFDYREDAPDLAGRWFPAFDRGVEAYHHVLTGRVDGIEMFAFVHERIWETGPKEEQYHNEREAYLVARLPGAPSEAVLERGAERTINDFGVHLRDNYGADFIGTEWLALHKGGFHDQRRLALHAGLLARLIKDAPPSVWAGA
jgi:hypothetical protein